MTSIQMCLISCVRPLITDISLKDAMHQASPNCWGYGEREVEINYLAARPERGNVVSMDNEAIISIFMYQYSCIYTCNDIYTL